MKNISCPVSVEKIPEYLPRVTAFYNISLMIAFAFTQSIFILSFLGIDFILRGFNLSKFSLIHFIASKTGKILQLSNKKIDKAPKQFAARLGSFMFIAAITTFLTGNMSITFGIVSMIAILSTLECAFNLCVGCYIYTYLVLPFYK